jgi:sortase A
VPIEFAQIPLERVVARPSLPIGATVIWLVVLALGATGCGGTQSAHEGPGPSPSSLVPSTPQSGPSSPSPRASSDLPDRAPAGVAPSDGTPRRASLTIPAIGLRDLIVEPYRGRTDDAAGTRLQDAGLAASPHGPHGGTGPGGLGNYQVTAHRNSSTAAFFDLPRLRPGQRVHVEAGGVRYTYEITTTRSTSFRSARSLAEQRAAVPGRPGLEPTRAMITLSTCATQEDHAAGNYWADEFDNPEHRIDKVGVLIAVRADTR